MSTSPDFSDEKVVEAIKEPIRRGSSSARETLAVYGVLYCRSFLVTRRSLRRFGFPGSFSEIAPEVADLEVAELLRQGFGFTAR